MNVAVRPAGPDDAEELERLWAAATSELEGERGGAVWSGQADRAGGYRAGDLSLVGTIDDVPVGYLVATLSTLADGSVLAAVSDVYVEPGARSIGVGEGLLAAAVEWAKEAGCIGIDAVVLPGMRESKNFFEAAGLVARLIVPHKSFR